MWSSWYGSLEINVTPRRAASVLDILGHANNIHKPFFLQTLQMSWFAWSKLSDMNSQTQQTPISEVPINLRLGLYLALREQHKIERIDGKYYAKIGGEFRPVRLPWSY